MGIVIAIFVTLVVAGSVLWIKPSRRDVRISHIRRIAMSLGMKVRLLDDKMRSTMFPWLDDYRGLVIYEHHQLGAPKGRELTVLRLQDAEKLHELELRRRSEQEIKLAEYVKAAPLDAEAVVLYPTGIGVLWREQGEEADVRALDQRMREMNTLL